MEAFRCSSTTILGVFRDASPLQVIAAIAGWGLSQAIGPGTVSSRKMVEGIEQHHVELLQALLLTLGRDQWGASTPSNPQMHTVITAVRDLSTAFHRRRRLQLEELEGDVDALVIAGLQERMRDHTQMVRNWGHYEDMLRITRTMHAPLDDAFAAKSGFRLSDVVVSAKTGNAATSARASSEVARRSVARSISEERSSRIVIPGR